MKLAKNPSIRSLVTFLNYAVKKRDHDNIRLVFKHIIKANGGPVYFAKQTHVSRQTVYNYLSGRSAMSFKFFDKALKEVGLRLTIEHKRRGRI